MSQFRNVIGLGKRRTALPFKTALKSVFQFNLRDPFSVIQFDENACVPAAIVLRLLYETGISLSTVSTKTVKRFMNMIHYKSLLGFTHKGIRIADFHLLEKNISFRSNIHLLLAFPVIRRYEGLSINLFKVTFHKDMNTYTVHPRHLSAHHANPSYLQCDLLLDSDTIRAVPYSSETYDHVLLILNLIRLTTGFQNASDPGRTKINALICRRCMRVFSDQGKYKLHLRICSAFGPGCVKRRVSSNILVHKTRVFLKSLCRDIPHVLKFNIKDLYRAVRPIIFGCADLECVNIPVKENASYSSCPYSKMPSQAVFEQRVIGAAYMFKNIFPNFALPSELKEPRCVFRQGNETEEQFFLSLFNMLRDDVKRIHRYEQNVLNYDQGTPQLKDLSLLEKIRFLGRQFCEICHTKFGSFKRVQNNKKCKVQKVLDHSHIDFITPAEPAPGRLRRVICQFCNWALSQSADSPKKSRCFFLHNSIG